MTTSITTVRSLVLGIGAAAVAGLAFVARRRLFARLREQPAWLLLPVAFGVALLWADGGWRSSFYLLSYAAVALAAVTAGLRWSVICGAILAAGYVAGLAVNGYSWAELKALHDADSVVANTGGYLIAAYFFAAPVSWLGGYVARINQIAAAETLVTEPSETRAASQTARLTVREIEVIQLLTAGATNDEIGARLYLSPRTVQTHIERAREKVDARNRTELAVIAVREGLVPPLVPEGSGEHGDSGTHA